jgi:hypothetical protein
MSLSRVKPRSNGHAGFRTFSCEPCGCVFSDVLAPTEVAERAMLLDLQADACTGRMH